MQYIASEAELAVTACFIAKDDYVANLGAIVGVHYERSVDKDEQLR